ncbi:MAG: outer membrane beta-barrel protein [Candidatus Kapaibacterium sp.]
MKLSFTMIILCLVVSSTTSQAQFVKGFFGIGPELGFGNGGSGNPFLVGLEGEYAVSKKNEMGPGILGAGLSVDYFSEAPTAATKNTYIPITPFASYHLGIMMDDPRLDPYFKLGLTYKVQTASVTIDNETISSTNGKFTLGFMAGVQYFIERNLSVQVQLSAGGAGTQFLTVGAKLGI